MAGAPGDGDRDPMIDFTSNPQQLAYLAVMAMLERKPVEMNLAADWQRPHNFPLPIEATPLPGKRCYRPLAILEWVDDTLRRAGA